MGILLSFKLVSTPVLMLLLVLWTCYLMVGGEWWLHLLTYITEDRKYSASVYVQFNGGGLIQQPPSVEISER